MKVTTLNRQVEAGRRRALTLDSELADVYAAALRRTGRNAAERFRTLASPRSLTAAVNPKPPDWTQPDPDELLDKPLSAAEQAKAERIHLRAITLAVPTVAKKLPDISFAIESPFALQLLAAVGTKGINLELASRAVIVKVLADAYQQGLSVQDTARQLQAAIDHLSDTTALMQARTDLVGLANGASLASVQILGDAAPPTKIWLATEDERTRETHAEADGQEVPLDQPFQVGDDLLNYPGDPAGSDAEVINCRCTVIYGDGVSVQDDALAASGAPPVAPLASGGLMDTSPEVTTAAVTVTVDGPQPDEAAAVRWQGILTLEGVPTLDGRYFAVGAWRWRELPLSLMVQFETAEGHDGAVVGGNIDGIWKVPYPDGGADAVAVMGTGLISSDECGQRTAQLVADDMLRGVSVDYQVLEAMLRNPDTGELLDPATVDPEQLFMSDYQIAALDAEIGAATVCSFPAFAEATIGLVASGEVYAAFSIRIVDADALTAAVSAPACPPLEWFETSEPPGLMPLTVTDDGRVFGHLAPWNVCHVGLPGGCTTAPKSRSGYAYFHVGEVDTADGARVSVGKLMVGRPGRGGKHANPVLSRLAAVKHYDDNTAVGAYVRAVDGRHGIWVCGAVRAGIDEWGLQELRANPPSGDWRPVNGQLELITGLSVPVPGFPVPRAAVAVVASADETTVESLVLTSGLIEPSERVLRALVAAGTLDADATGLPPVRRPASGARTVEAVPVRRPAPVR